MNRWRSFVLFLFSWCGLQCMQVAAATSALVTPEVANGGETINLARMAFYDKEHCYVAGAKNDGTALTNVDNKPYSLMRVNFEDQPDGTVQAKLASLAPAGNTTKVNNQAGRPNPLFGKLISYLVVDGLGCPVAAVSDDGAHVYVVKSTKDGTQVLRNASADNVTDAPIKDASNNIAGKIHALAATMDAVKFKRNGVDEYTKWDKALFAAVSDYNGVAKKSWATATANNRGISVSLVKDDHLLPLKADDFQADPEANIANNKAVKINYTNAAAQLAIGADATLTDDAGVQLWWDDQLQRLFIVLSGVKSSNVDHKGAVGVVLGQFNPAGNGAFTLGPVFDLNVNRFGANAWAVEQGIFGGVTRDGKVATTNLYHPRTLHTSTGKDYLVVVGGVQIDDPSTAPVKSWVNAIPLMPKTNPDSPTVGKVAKIDFSAVLDLAANAPQVNRWEGIHTPQQASVGWSPAYLDVALPAVVSADKVIDADSPVIYKNPGAGSLLNTQSKLAVTSVLGGGTKIVAGEKIFNPTKLPEKTILSAGNTILNGSANVAGTLGARAQLTLHPGDVLGTGSELHQGTKLTNFAVAGGELTIDGADNPNKAILAKNTTLPVDTYFWNKTALVWSLNNRLGVDLDYYNDNTWAIKGASGKKIPANKVGKVVGLDTVRNGNINLLANQSVTFPVGANIAAGSVTVGGAPITLGAGVTVTVGGSVVVKGASQLKGVTVAGAAATLADGAFTLTDVLTLPADYIVPAGASVTLGDETTLPAQMKVASADGLVLGGKTTLANGSTIKKDSWLIGANSIDVKIQDIQVIGDSVYATIYDDGNADNGVESGIYKSSPIFNSKGIVRCWTPWTRVMGATDYAHGFGLDKEKGTYSYITSADGYSGAGKDVINAKTTQWSFGVNDLHTNEPLNKVLQPLFGDHGIMTLVNFDERTPGFKADAAGYGHAYLSMMVVTGDRRVALVQTGKYDDAVGGTKTFVPVGKFEVGANVFMFDGSTTVPTPAAAVLKNVGVVTCAELLRSTDANEGWLAVGGDGGVAVLCLANGNGFDGHAGLEKLAGGGAGDYPAGANWKFVQLTVPGDVTNRFANVRKLVTDPLGKFLYVLTPKKVYRIKMSAANFAAGNLFANNANGVVTIASVEDSTSDGATKILGGTYDEFYDMFLMYSDANGGNTSSYLLLATSRGLFANSYNDDVSELRYDYVEGVDNTNLIGVQWMRPADKSGANNQTTGAALSLEFVNCYKGGKMNIAGDIASAEGNLYALALDPTAQYLAMYRFEVGGGTIKAFEEPFTEKKDASVAKPFVDPNDRTNYFCKIGTVTDGTTLTFNGPKNFQAAPAQALVSLGISPSLEMVQDAINAFTKSKRNESLVESEKGYLDMGAQLGSSLHFSRLVPDTASGAQYMPGTFGVWAGE